MSDFRDPGIIESVRLGKEDHGILTCWVFIRFKGSSQGFGGLCLQGKHPIVKDAEVDYSDSYVKDLCATFDVANLDDLVGRNCVALRCYAENNEPIEGLLDPVSKKRFTHTTWRKKHNPEVLDPCAERKRFLASSIEHWKRRVREEETRLELVRINYRSAEHDEYGDI